MNEDVVLTQSDMDASNFGVGLDGRAVLFDAATIQALPVTLANFTLLRTTPFATAVSQHVFDADKMVTRLASPSLKSLAEVRQFLSNTFDDSLGTFGLACFCFVPGLTVLMKPSFFPQVSIKTATVELEPDTESLSAVTHLVIVHLCQ